MFHKARLAQHSGLRLPYRRIWQQRTQPSHTYDVHLMPLTWPKPLPFVLLAAPLLLMWAPARAFLGSAVSKLPSSTRFLSETILRRRHGRGGGGGGGGGGSGKGLSCRAMTPSVLEGVAADAGGGGAKKVIVITGPTATGKSSIALALCKSIGGEIVSCDSVQVYRDVFIGCNKPSEEEMREVRHHLVDVASLDETFNAGDFVDRAQEAIDDILSRGRVPVVVGGTMMYVQWLVHGKPDAPKREPAVAQAVATELLPFQERGDWDGALQILVAANATRAASLHRNDWYRLSRSLEVLRVPSGEDAYTGLRTPLSEKYDFRSFFIVGDRERLFRRIDRRCEEMLQRGMLTETADLLVRGMLDPASPAGRAIGYRQAIDFLSQEAQLAGDKDAEAAAAAAAGGGGVAGSGSGSGVGEKVPDPDTRFLQFCMTFAAKTRQYSGEQMKWFRSPKGRDFSWQAWSLGGPIEEGCRSARETRSFPAPVVRAGGGCDWLDVAASIAESFDISREAFEEQLHGEHQASLRRENLMRAGDMKRYVPRVSLLGDKKALRGLVEETKGLATRLSESKRERQVGVEAGVRETVQGWHAGSR